jgi:hypothetical protein
MSILWYLTCRATFLPAHSYDVELLDHTLRLDILAKRNIRYTGIPVVSSPRCQERLDAPEGSQVSQLESPFRISPLRCSGHTENQHPQAILVIRGTECLSILGIENTDEVWNGR